MVPGTIFLGKAKPGLLRGLAGVPLDPLWGETNLKRPVATGNLQKRCGWQRTRTGGRFFAL